MLRFWFMAICVAMAIQSTVLADHVGYGVQDGKLNRVTVGVMGIITSMTPIPIENGVHSVVQQWPSGKAIILAGDGRRWTSETGLPGTWQLVAEPPPPPGPSDRVSYGVQDGKLYRVTTHLFLITGTTYIPIESGVQEVAQSPSGRVFVLGNNGTLWSSETGLPNSWAETATGGRVAAFGMARGVDGTLGIFAFRYDRALLQIGSDGTPTILTANVQNASWIEGRIKLSINLGRLGGLEIELAGHHDFDKPGDPPPGSNGAGNRGAGSLGTPGGPQGGGGGGHGHPSQGFAH
jgi:hypothetical protein